MRKFLATKSSVDYGYKTGSGTIAGSWELNVLANGALAVLENNGTLISGTAPVFTKDSFYLAVGRDNAAENSDLSPLLFREGFTYNKLVYSAPVAKIMYLGYDAATASYDLYNYTTLVAGTIASVRVVDLEKPVWDNSREYTVSHVITAADTKATIIADLVIQLNSTRANKVCTALDVTSSTDYGIRLTGDTAGVNFTAYLEDALKDGDIIEYKMINRVYNGAATSATACAKGNGTYAQIKAWEDDFLTTDGKANLSWMGEYLWSVTSNLVAGETYTIYVLVSINPSDGRVLINEKNPPVTVILAIPSGETGASGSITAMDNLLAAV
jgi:hypothetical protein